jgi:nucleoside-diphosphate-sugar epimerase
VVERLVGSLQVNSAKATRLLGWVPRVSVEDGLRRTVEWYQSRSG